MPIGTVKFFNLKKGYGFIQRDQGGAGKGSKFVNADKGYGFIQRGDEGGTGKSAKFFGSDKGYGFIQPGEGRDSFVHISSVPKGYASQAAGVIAGSMAGSSGRTHLIEPEKRLGKSSVTGSFALPNGDRIGTVRRDVMARVLGRPPGDGS